MVAQMYMQEDYAKFFILNLNAGLREKTRCLDSFW